MAEDFAAGADDLVAERERVAILLEEAAAGDVAGLSEHLAVLLETERARRPVLARSYDKGTVAALGVLVLLWILLALRGGGRTPPPRPVEEAPGPPSGDRGNRELLLRGVAAALVARAERIAGRTNALRESRLKLQAALEDANLDRTLHDGVPVRDEIAIMADVLADLRRETGELSSLGKRLEGLAPETAIDINACIEEAVGAAGARVARRFGDVADVRGRRPDIVLALTAIVDAALDAAGEKGTVTVATEPDGAEVAVTVAGAAFDAHPGVFRPDDEAGLRLVLASGLVERNGGALAILTEPDGGTAVRLSFPEA